MMKKTQIMRKVAAMGMSVASILYFAGCATEDESYSSSWHTTRAGAGGMDSGGGETYQWGQSSGSSAGADTSHSGSTVVQPMVSHSASGVTGSGYFPTGVRESSALYLQKILPAEVIAGKPFDYEYRVQNLTGLTLGMVTVSDLISGNMTINSSTPAADSVSGGTARWTIDQLGPHETKVIKVNAVANGEGQITLCGKASYDPQYCEVINVTRPAIALTKSLEPAGSGDGSGGATLCDPITMRLVVSNTGSSTLNGVVVNDNLPAGLTSSGGQSSLSYNVGTLAPGQSKEIVETLSAANVGNYNNTAVASSSEGVEATASDSISVSAPSLSVVCNAPDQRYIGRPINYCFTVTNSGNAPANASSLCANLPGGASFVSANNGGYQNGGQVCWDLGTIPAGGSKEVCMELVANAPGDVCVTATTSSACGQSANCNACVQIRGIPAILLEVIDLDDPIEVGSEVVYNIKVTNQGSAVDTNIRVICELENSQQFVAGTGETAVSGSGTRIVMDPVPSLAPKQVVQWNVRIKAAAAGDVRFTVVMNSDQIQREVRETESTNQY